MPDRDTGGRAPAAKWPGLAGFDIDGDFILAQEGHEARMYVPAKRDPKTGQMAPIGHSGPTIGLGVDLGGKDVAYLRSLKLAASLEALLTPYLGRKGLDAYRFVQDHPLELTPPQLAALDAAVQRREFTALAAKFDAASRIGPFRGLPRLTQTAIASLYFQYGSGDPARKTPRFWRQITTGDWDGAHRELLGFGDAFASRRRREAALLWQDIRSGRLRSR